MIFNYSKPNTPSPLISIPYSSQWHNGSYHTYFITYPRVTSQMFIAQGTVCDKRTFVSNFVFQSVTRTWLHCDAERQRCCVTLTGSTSLSLSSTRASLAHTPSFPHAHSLVPRVFFVPYCFAPLINWNEDSGYEGGFTGFTPHVITRDKRRLVTSQLACIISVKSRDSDF